MSLVATTVVAATATATKKATKRTKSTARLTAVASRITLLPTTEQRSGQLTNEVARPTAALSGGATVVLLSTAKEGARELANEVIRPATAVALLVVAHERIHGKATQRAVARLSFAADTS